MLEKIQKKEATCVLVYNLENDGNPEPHCVFIDKLVQDTFGGKRHYFCINSWGKEHEFVVKEVDRPNNQVFEVTVTWQPSQSSSTLALWQRLLGWVSERVKIPTQPSLVAKPLPRKVPFVPSTNLEPMFTQPIASPYSFKTRISQQLTALSPPSWTGRTR